MSNVPTASEILTAIATESPWFPSQLVTSAKQEVEEIVIRLMQAQLIEARDWIKGQGQGFGLTAEGRRALVDPTLLPRLLSGETVALHEAPPSPTTYDRGERARSAYYTPERPLITQALILLNIVVFLIGLGIAWRVGSGRLAYLNGHDMNTLVKLGAESGDRLVAGEWWRLGTANFVHVGFVHLLLNIYCLGIVGSLAENLWGRWRFAVIYLVSGLAGSSLAMMLQPVSLVAGASGATWGVMTSLAVWLYQYRQHFETDFVSDFAKRLAFAIILNGAFSFFPRVSWHGHLGGALSGAAMAIALDWIRPGYPRRTKAGIVAAIGIPVAVIGCLLFVASHSRAWRPLIGYEAAKQQAKFRISVEAELNTISPKAIQSLLNDAIHSLTNVTRHPKLEKRAQDMLTQATALQERAGSLSAGCYAADMPQKLAAYCDAVKECCQRLINFYLLEGNRQSPVLEMIPQIEHRWNDLFTNRWMENR